MDTIVHNEEPVITSEGLREIGIHGVGIVQIGDSVIGQQGKSTPRRRFEVIGIGDGFLLVQSPSLKTRPGGPLRRIKLAWENILGHEVGRNSLIEAVTDLNPLGDALGDLAASGWAQFISRGPSSSRESFCVGITDVHARAGVVHGTPGPVFYDATLELFWRYCGNV